MLACPRIRCLTFPFGQCSSSRRLAEKPSATALRHTVRSEGQSSRSNAQSNAKHGAAQALRYGYTTGGKGALTPTSIRWAAGSPPFINTGRKVISRYDYLFDAGSGLLGFQRAP